MRQASAVFILFFLLAPSAARAFSASGFENPESMQVDPKNGTYYVSNVNGDPLAKDGNGYISKITPNGNVVIQKFIGAKPEEALLDAPKGLAVLGPALYVTDIDKVKSFDKETGRSLNVVDLSAQGAKFLNDITVNPSGKIFVSDMLADKIFKIDPQKNNEVTIYAQGEVLGQPNGLAIDPRNGKLMAVTWGSGEILEIDGNGKVHKLKRGMIRLDGLDTDVEGNLYVSSFEKGEIYRVPFYGRGTLSTFLSGLTTPADISCDRKKHELLIPSFNGNTVSTEPLFLKKAAPLPAREK